MRLPAVRGNLLEEIVLRLLVLVGYRILRPGDEGTRAGAAGLEVQGRGEWHQIDALAAFDRTPAFMYPLRLIVEAKCFASKRVGIEVARNSLGSHKDISENYFTYVPVYGAAEPIRAPRFNYHTAIFSSSGYTPSAQKFSIAHQIFLIQYQRVAVLRPVINALLKLRAKHLTRQTRRAQGAEITHRIREHVRAALGTRTVEADLLANPFSEEGQEYINQQIVERLIGIRGSYFGMLQGKWPMHLLSVEPLPSDLFDDSDELLCRVYRFDGERWAFSPSDVKQGQPGWFRLEFDLPEEVAGLVERVRKDAVALANVKQEQFSYLDLSGVIGGIQRQVRLVLDPEWLGQYLQRVGARPVA